MSGVTGRNSVGNIGGGAGGGLVLLKSALLTGGFPTSISVSLSPLNFDFDKYFRAVLSLSGAFNITGNARFWCRINDHYTGIYYDRTDNVNGTISTESQNSTDNFRLNNYGHGVNSQRFECTMEIFKNKLDGLIYGRWFFQSRENGHAIGNCYFPISTFQSITCQVEGTPTTAYLGIGTSLKLFGELMA